MHRNACLFICIAFLASISAKPSPKVDEKSTLDEVIANAQLIINNVTATLGVEKLPDSKQVIDTLAAQANAIAAKVQEGVEKLKTEVKANQGNIDNVVKSVEAKLNEVATSLQQAVGPEATAKANEIKKNIDDSLKAVVEQAQKIAKAVEPDATKAKDDVVKAVKTLVDGVAEAGAKLQNEIKTKIEAAPKTK